MAFGKFGAQKMGETQFNQDDAARLSPEQQMNKMREQARSGGAGGGASRVKPPVEISVTPPSQEITEPETNEESRGITLELTPDANDKDMEELLGILQKKGFKAALHHLDRLDNPHLEDDFHRLLVQYTKEGHSIHDHKHLDEHTAHLVHALDTVLLEVAVPTPAPDKGGSLKDVVNQMQQLYLAIMPFLPPPDPIFFKDYTFRKLIHREHLTFELAVSQGKEEAVFYVAVPRKKRDIIEKQIFAVFPRAYISEKKDDYNPFNQFGVTLAAYGTYARSSTYTIKTSDDFTYDPLNVTFSSLSKMTKEGEGAAIQICIAPAGDYHKNRMLKVIADLNKGKHPPNHIFTEHGYFYKLPWWRILFPFLYKEIEKSFETTEEAKKRHEKKDVNSAAVEAVQKKLKSVMYGVNIRAVASARTKERARHILSDIQATFGQYDDPKGNRIVLRPITGKKKLKAFIRAFIFRTFDRFDEDGFMGFLEQMHRELTEHVPVPNLFLSPLVVMNVEELATVYHLAIAGGGTSSREAKTAGAKRTPAPPGLPEKGIIIGKNVYSNVETIIRFPAEDRLRHMYVIGQTGTGKTTFLKNMIIQDIENGEGVCFIDPHGVDVLEILSRVPKERYEDVVYFDPAYIPRPMGLNMLEYDPRYPEQKTFVVDEMFKIFKKLYGDVPEAFGPIFEQYFRNATLLVLEDPDTGSTLMDISRVLADEDFRHLKLSRCRNPIVRHFWENIAEQVRGEGDLRNVVPYITSKFDIFIANEIMRPIVGQQRSAFDFKDIMDNKKILLVNLSKGRLGDLNSNLLGLVLVGKIMMSALSRTEYLHLNPPPFYLYIDEFQNVTTDTVAIILSEARKFRLSMIMAHQYISQLTTGTNARSGVREAVFGNVGTMVSFRVGSEDADFLVKQYAPSFEVGDFVNADNYYAYLKLLAGGKPVVPSFTLQTIPFQPGDFVNVEALKQISYQRYGRERDVVEEEIRQKYENLIT